MLFYYTKYVIQKQMERDEDGELEDEESDEEGWFWHVNIYNIIKVEMASFVLSNRRSCIISIIDCSNFEDYIIQ